MTLRASYLLNEHYDQISPTSARINNNINNERGSKNWVDFVSCRKNKKCSVAYVVLHFPDKYDADCVTLTSLILPTIKQTLKQRCCYSDNNGGGSEMVAFHHFVCEFRRTCYFFNCDSYAVVKGCKLLIHSYLLSTSKQTNKQTNKPTDILTNRAITTSFQGCKTLYTI